MEGFPKLRLIELQPDINYPNFRISVDSKFRMHNTIIIKL